MEEKLTGRDRPISIDYALPTDLNWYRKDSDSVCTVSMKNNWKRLHTTIGSIDLKEKPERTAAGIHYSTEITARHPGHNDETPADIASLSGIKMVLKITYRSGRVKIIGNTTSAPRLYITALSSGSTILAIEGTWQSDKPNLWHSTVIDSNGVGGL